MKYAKPIEQLLEAPSEEYDAMISWFSDRDYVSELSQDITKIYPSPVLGVALGMLIKTIEDYTKAYKVFSAAGYTVDDAMALNFHILNKE